MLAYVEAAPARRPLPSRAFLTFLAGLAVSKLGDAIYTFALPWIAYELTRSSVVMGTLYATEILPVLLFGALAGVYVDRWDRRRLLLTADALRAAAIAAVPLLQLAGRLQIWHLYLLAFVLALTTLACDVATTAVIPELAAGAADLTRTNALHQSVLTLGTLAGPALAGLLIAQLGAFPALWLDVASFSTSFLAVRGLKGLRRPAGGDDARNVVQGMAEGLRWLWGSPVIRVLALQAMTGNFGFGMVSAVLMFYLRSTLGLSAELSGLNYTLIGLGGLVGSVAIVPLARRFRRGALYPAILLFGLAGLLLTAGLPLWWAPGAGLGMVMGCNVAWVVLSTSVRQELIPAGLMGRVLSFSRILSTAAMPLGATLGGLLMQQMPPAAVFAIAAAAKGGEWLIARCSAMARL